MFDVAPDPGGRDNCLTARKRASTSASWSLPEPSTPDPDSNAVATRGREENIGGALAAKIRSSLTYYRDIAASGDAEVRLHPCTRYASMFRYDDEVTVNPHAFGEPASANPTLHLRHLDGMR
jgi:hypothetical protein